jgi:hypothetical protein
MGAGLRQEGRVRKNEVAQACSNILSPGVFKPTSSFDILRRKFKSERAPGIKIEREGRVILKQELCGQFSGKMRSLGNTFLMPVNSKTPSKENDGKINQG